jgi:FMN phosphatase YigB (HAD superfamily)
MKEIIGVDLDGTLLNIAEAEMKLLSNYNIYDYPTDWGFKDYPYEVRQLLYKMFKTPEIMCDLDPFPGVTNKVNEWKSKGYDLIVITARDKEIEQETKKFVWELFQLPCIVLNSHDKKQAFLDTGINCWIDDNPENVIIAKNMGILSILISNITTPYNWHVRNKVNWVEALTDIKL